MSPTNPISYAGVFLLLLFCNYTQAQTFGTFASAVWLTDCNQSNFFNTSGTGPNLIGPAGNVFDNANLGAYTQNSATLILRGAEVKTFKTVGVANVCSVRMYYRVYLQSGTPGAFNSIDIPFLNGVLKKLRLPSLENKVICTNVMTKYMIPDIMSSNLNYMSQIFGIPHSQAHRAIEDARATGRLLLKYMDIFESKNISIE